MNSVCGRWSAEGLKLLPNLPGRTCLLDGPFSHRAMGQGAGILPVMLENGLTHLGLKGIGAVGKTKLVTT